MQILVLTLMHNSAAGKALSEFMSSGKGILALTKLELQTDRQIIKRCPSLKAIRIA